MAILFLAIVCLLVNALIFICVLNLRDHLKHHQAILSQQYDVINKFLLKLPTSEELANLTRLRRVENSGIHDNLLKLHGEIENAKNELIDLFQKEKVELAQMKARTTDTFKNLRAAFKSSGKDQQDDD